MPLGGVPDVDHGAPGEVENETPVVAMKANDICPARFGTIVDEKVVAVPDRSDVAGPTKSGPALPISATAFTEIPLVMVTV